MRDYEEYDAPREVKPIGGWARFGHYIVDTVILYLLILITVFVASVGYGVAAKSGFDEYEEVFNLLVSGSILLVYPVYYIFCESIWQRTPGKLLTKAYVIDEYGRKPEFGTILLRTVIRFVPFEYFSCLGEPSRGWHDQWSKTWVVHKTELEELKRLLAEQDEDYF